MRHQRQNDESFHQSLQKWPWSQRLGTVCSWEGQVKHEFTCGLATSRWNYRRYWCYWQQAESDFLVKERVASLAVWTSCLSFKCKRAVLESRFSIIVRRLSSWRQSSAILLLQIELQMALEKPGDTDSWIKSDRIQDKTQQSSPGWS